MLREPQPALKIPSATYTQQRSPPVATPRTASTDRSVYFDADSTVDSISHHHGSGETTPKRQRQNEKANVFPGDYSFSDTSVDRQTQENYSMYPSANTHDSEKGKMAGMKDKVKNLLHKGSKDSDGGDEQRGRSTATKARQDTVDATNQTMPLANGVNGAADPVGADSAVSKTSFNPNANGTSTEVTHANNKRSSLDNGAGVRANDYAAGGMAAPIATTTNGAMSDPPAHTNGVVANGVNVSNAVDANLTPKADKRNSLPQSTSPRSSIQYIKRSSLPPSRNASPNPSSTVYSGQHHRAESLSSQSKERAATGAFSAGPGATGPAAVPAGRVENANGDGDNEMVDGGEEHERIQRAEQNLSGQVVGRIEKEETKDRQRVSKIIMSEAKSQKKNLGMAIKDLSKIQKVQKQAAADESAASKALSKCLQDSQKTLNKHLSAKAAFEASQAALKAAEDRAEACKEEAKRATEVLSAKAREVEELRVRRGVDEREREVKLKEMGFGEDDRKRGGVMSKLPCFH